MNDGELWFGLIGDGSAGGELFGATFGVGGDSTAFGIGHEAFGPKNLGVAG